MHRPHPTVAQLGFAFLALASSLSASAQPPAITPPPESVSTFATDWCLDCHDSSTRKGGFALDMVPFSADAAAHDKWVRVYDRVLSGEMPPKDKAQPSAAERRAFLDALARELQAQHRSTRGTVLRRLNRAEYENTLRDLFGIHTDLASYLPEDPISHGFDNLGSQLGLSDAQLRVYLDLAGRAFDEVLALGKTPRTTKLTAGLPKDRVAPPGPLSPENRERVWAARPDGAIVIFNSGNLPGAYIERFRAPVAGRYRIRLSAYAHQSETPLAFSLRAVPSGGGLGNTYGTTIRNFEVSAQPSTFELETVLQAGDRLRLFTELSNDQRLLRERGPADYPGPGLAVLPFEIEGPLYDTWPPRGQSLLFGDLLAKATETPTRAARPRNAEPAPLSVDSPAPATDATRALGTLAEAAFRRPVASAELEPYLALFRAEQASGSSYQTALRTAATAVLCAPEFLYLIERPGPLDDHALAARLAYFLWRGPPDDELRAAATKGNLRQPAVLRAQTERLLSHPRAERFVNDFTDAWLNLREIDFTTPDERLYPEFDLFLRDSMLGETRAFFAEILRADFSPLNFVKSDFAMLNSRLARLYDLPPVSGLELRRTPLPPDGRRGGVLTQAAVLKVSANGVNTSPVVRGVYILERILGTPPPPPPPSVPGLEPDIRGATTLRDLLQKHRESPQCYGCHTLIDPPGFALENYDVIGGWRERFRGLSVGEKVNGKVRGRPIVYRLGHPVDASGETTDGARFTSFQEYQEILLRDPVRINRTVLKKLLTFGTGRELGFSDRPELDRLAQDLTKNRRGLREFIHAAVQSEIFRTK